jgi:hypothetical protein
MHDPVWELDPEDRMMILVWASLEDHEQGRPPRMRIYLGEAIESAGRIPVMEHIREIERSPWIYRWHAELSYDALRQPESQHDG